MSHKRNIYQWFQTNLQWQVYNSTTITLPRSKLKISSKLEKLHTKVVSRFSIALIRRTDAAFFALTKAFLNTSKGWLCRDFFNNLFKSVLIAASNSLHSEMVRRLEVLGEKNCTVSWFDPMLQPNMFTSPVKVLMRAIPLTQTFCKQNKLKIGNHTKNAMCSLGNLTVQAAEIEYTPKQNEQQ